MGMLPLLMELAGVYNEGYRPRRLFCAVAAAGLAATGAGSVLPIPRDNRRIDQHELARAQYQAIAGRTRRALTKVASLSN